MPCLEDNVKAIGAGGSRESALRSADASMFTDESDCAATVVVPTEPDWHADKLKATTVVVSTALNLAGRPKALNG